MDQYGQYKREILGKNPLIDGFIKSFDKKKNTSQMLNEYRQNKKDSQIQKL